MIIIQKQYKTDLINKRYFKIFGTPITWLMAELFSLVLFFLVIAHASKQESSKLRIFEFIGLLIAAAIYENVGVAGGVYDYDLHRILMVGKVPLEILLKEAEIWYAGLLLAEKMRLPKWAQPFVVGLFASVQDMTLDPSAVYDLHLFDGALSGQWNWAIHYDSTFFGIPFFNFSGWLWMMTYYTAFVLLGRWLYQKSKNRIVENAYPFLAGILTPMAIGTPITIFLLWATPLVGMNSRTAEIVMLTINYLFPMILIFAFRKRYQGIDLKTSQIAFGIPIAMHLYDIVIGYGLGITQAYIPSILIAIIHFAFFFYLRQQSKRQLNEA